MTAFTPMVRLQRRKMHLRMLEWHQWSLPQSKKLVLLIPPQTPQWCLRRTPTIIPRNRTIRRIRTPRKYRMVRGSRVAPNLLPIRNRQLARVPNRLTLIMTMALMAPGMTIMVTMVRGTTNQGVNEKGVTVKYKVTPF